MEGPLGEAKESKAREGPCPLGPEAPRLGVRVYFICGWSTRGSLLEKDGLVCCGKRASGTKKGSRRPTGGLA